MRTSDKASFIHILARLSSDKERLSAGQREHLTYLKIMETLNEGNSMRSIPMLAAFISKTRNRQLRLRAKSELIVEYMRDKNYVRAFSLANDLLAHASDLRNENARIKIYSQINQILNRQGQYNEALKYARRMKAEATNTKNKCLAEVDETQTLLYRGGTLTSSSPAFRKSIDTCLAANKVITADALRLDWASLMDEEGHPQQALAYLKRVAPVIIEAGYQPHIASLHVTRAQAYLIEHNYESARKSALHALATNAPGSMSWTMQAAYKVLYQVQQHIGQYKDALSSYKKYMAQEKAFSDDARAQALAYQIVKQKVLTKRLRLEQLSKQNRILQLRQSLDRKTAETNRLYITLLLLVLASIAFWAWRIKHSQIRFRNLARHDDLTGVYNRQYFFDRAERILGRLQRAGAHACLLILDMDHFKRINDVYGHLPGDKVLKHVTRLCQDVLRDSDLFGRLGGEEFGILMPGCTAETGREIGERIRHALSLSSVHVLEDACVTVTASIGLATTEISGYALKPLLIAADQALYAAKRAGRNRLAIHDGQMAPEMA